MFRWKSNATPINAKPAPTAETEVMKYRRLQAQIAVAQAKASTTGQTARDNDALWAGQAR